MIGKGNSEVGIVSLGSCDGAVREALDVLGRQKIDVDYLRVKAFPFNNDVEAFLKSHSTIFRGRTESRRAIEVAADSRDRGGEIEAQFHSELQRIPHVGRADRQWYSSQARRGPAAVGGAALRLRDQCHI